MLRTKKVDFPSAYPSERPLDVRRSREGTLHIAERMGERPLDVLTSRRSPGRDKSAERRKALQKFT